ncbi:MAG: DUF3857 domain-containing protein [Xanthomonadales bacterium]|nr:DUF3857 domain-containing protein [Xanthomonadales bacterium]
MRFLHDGLRRALLAMGLCAMATVATAQEYAMTAVPDWVEPVAVPSQASLPDTAATGGTQYLLLDTQLRLAHGNPTYFRRLAMLALNRDGVENVAQIQLDFDPSYERLRLHVLNVWRAGEATSRLRTSEIQLLQREPDLESLIVDGDKTVSIFIDDVRIGDVVEYAYSIEGDNPVFADRNFGAVRLQWGAPVERVHTRMLLPPDRHLRFEGSDDDLQIRQLEDGWQAYRWQQQAMPALVVEDDAPAWYQPQQRIRWTEFEDWHQVVQWAQPLYRRPSELPAELQQVAARIAGEHSEPADRMAAALRWVQSEIRYLGIELGAGSHAPRQPDEVLQRRYGDCKDKTLLLLALLDQLDVPAVPALVSTELRLKLAERLPSPGAFNHVLVRADIDGHSYWIDPTRDEQPGTAQTLYQPDYGLALPVADGVVALQTMFPERSPNRRTVHHQIDSRQGLEQTASFTVTTLSEGSYAESSRSEFAGQSHDDVRKQYLNFYAGYYEGIRSAGPIEVESIAASNQFRIVERYELPRFWQREEAESRRAASVEAPDIRAYLSAPSETLRVAPLALAHPVEMVQTLEVLLPSDWPDEHSKEVVEDPHFRFVREVDSQGSHLLITDRYTSLADHVPADAVPAYAEKLEEARGKLGYQLYQYDDAIAQTPVTATSMPPAVLFFSALVLVICSWLAVWVYRYDPAPDPRPADPRLTGIGGWLVLPLLGLLLQPIVTLVTMATNLDAYSEPLWSSLTVVGGSAYDSWWIWALLFDLASSLALLILVPLLLVLFLKRRSSVPHLYISLLLWILASNLISLWATGQIEGFALDVRKELQADAVRSVFSTLIWASYFVVSVRVRSTFTRRRGESAAMIDSPPSLPTATTA